MLTPLVQAIVIGWLPGAAVFRAAAGRARPARGARRRGAALLAGDRQHRACRSSAVLALAASGRYSFERLLVVDALASRPASPAPRGSGCGSVRAAPRPDVVGAACRWRSLLLGAWRFFPPSEYIIGGKDPGVYMNEGVQIAQRGALVVTRSGRRPPSRPFARDLFFPSRQRRDYYSGTVHGVLHPGPRAGTRGRPVPAPLPGVDCGRLRPRWADRRPADDRRLGDARRARRVLRGGTPARPRRGGRRGRACSRSTSSRSGSRAIRTPKS